MAIFAFATKSSFYVFTETVYYRFPEQRAVAYRLVGVPPGDYFVVAVFRTNSIVVNLQFPAAYTKAVLCGRSQTCTDHSLLAVVVGPGQTVTGVDPIDWVGDVDTYPLVPANRTWGLTGQDPWSHPRDSLPYGDPKNMANGLVGWDAELVDSSAGCQMNRACVWYSDWRNWQAASYVVSQLGTNGLFRTCTTYALKDSTGYRYVDFNCRRVAQAFPVLGGVGKLAYSPGLELEPSCINFHVAPDLKSTVSRCLPVGTDVTIDDGPTYVPQASPYPNDATLNYWWHVVGKGWVVHHYLMESA